MGNSHSYSALKKNDDNLTEERKDDPPPQRSEVDFKILTLEEFNSLYNTTAIVDMKTITSIASWEYKDLGCFLLLDNKFKITNDECGNDRLMIKRRLRDVQMGKIAAVYGCAYFRYEQCYAVAPTKVIFFHHLPTA